MLKYAAYEIADQIEPDDKPKREEPSQLSRALPWLAGLAGVGTAGYLASRYLGGSAPASGNLIASAIGLPREAYESSSRLLGQGPGNALTHGVATGVVGGAARAYADYRHASQDLPANLSVERLQLLNSQKSVPGGAPGRFGAAVGLGDPTDVAQVQVHATSAAKNLGYATPEAMFTDFRRQGFKTIGDAQTSMRAILPRLPNAHPNLPGYQRGIDSLDDMVANVRTNRMSGFGRLGRAAAAAGVGVGAGALGSWVSDWGRNIAADGAE